MCVMLRDGTHKTHSRKQFMWLW